MPPFNPAMIGAPSPVGRGGGGGPVLLSRTWYYATTTISVPAKAARIDARAIGGGAANSTNADPQTAGGGGAYARVSKPCSPGQVVNITVPPPPGQNSDGSASVVALAGQVILSAAPGSAYKSGGQASACIGDVRRSGGDGGQSQTSAPTAGTNGGTAGASTSGDLRGGGGSAGDLGDADTLNLFGNGYPSPTGGSERGGYGGGGTPGSTPKSGLVVIEFWSA